jgi:hypothetical protein
LVDTNSAYYFGYWEATVSTRTPRNITVRNNLVYDLRSGIADQVALNSYLSDEWYLALKDTFTFANNHYYVPNGTPRFGIAAMNDKDGFRMGSSYTSFAQWQTTMNYEQNSHIGSDPCFVNAAQGNFFLSANTPCPNAGAFPLDSVDHQPPATPTGLKVFKDFMPDTQLYVHWDEPADFNEVAGYRLYRNNQLIRDLVSTGFLDTGLAPGDYSYTVEAYDRAGNTSSRSAPASANSSSQNKPSPPVNLRVR